MRAEGKQLEQITRLIEADVIVPVIDQVFPFEQTNEALSYVETGRSKGKVVIKVKQLFAYFHQLFKLQDRFPTT